MNRYFVVIVLIVIPNLFLTSYIESANKGKETKVEETIVIENFDWLLGEWKRKNEDAGKETFEVWTKINNSEYYGVGFTLQNNDTLSQEKIRLVESNGKWNLEVQSPNDSIPTKFIMTSNGHQEFICENKLLDFPKMIKYWKKGNEINAIVSGDNMEILFEFERIRKE